ncbi:MAG: hypothetical protein L0332_20515 [Chloroflexi bacterium]|nr:hypothetical protein [Chloroflexota bacterium]MCI0580287.1 hypothetical protein [Chloroflexota bacterium]MCI0643698.1 hypothetical protein [Chloroflexota bacterium]MCI0729082.1 hypothetical protein [Chloroflexota bacterium]
MLRVKGIYDGEKVKLLEPVSLPPDTSVEVLIPEETDDQEEIYWQRLYELGLIKEIRSAAKEARPFAPIQVTGEPVSQTIIRERR